MPSSKDNILENARRLFADHGFKGTTIAQIAKTSNVTDAAIYRHYRSKQDVFDTIIAKFIERHSALLGRIHDRQKSGYCLLESLVMDHCAFVQDNMTDMRVIFSTYTTIPSARAAIDRMHDNLVATVTACLERGISDGSVRDDIDKHETATIIAILLMGLNRRRIYSPESPELARGVVAFCQRSLRS